MPDYVSLYPTDASGEKFDPAIHNILDESAEPQLSQKGNFCKFRADNPNSQELIDKFHDNLLAAAEGGDQTDIEETLNEITGDEPTAPTPEPMTPPEGEGEKTEEEQEAKVPQDGVIPHSGSAKFPEVFNLKDGDSVTLEEVLTAAFVNSKLTEDQWNALPDSAVHALIQSVIDTLDLEETLADELGGETIEVEEAETEDDSDDVMGEGQGSLAEEYSGDIAREMILQTVESCHKSTSPDKELPNFSGGNAGSDYRGAGYNLAGMDLSGQDLRSAIFNDCNLQGVNFQGANLQGARFLGCDVKGADFTGANMDFSIIERSFDKEDIFYDGPKQLKRAYRQ